MLLGYLDSEFLTSAVCVKDLAGVRSVTVDNNGDLTVVDPGSGTAFVLAAAETIVPATFTNLAPPLSPQLNLVLRGAGQLALAAGLSLDVTSVTSSAVSCGLHVPLLATLSLRGLEFTLTRVGLLLEGAVLSPDNVTLAGGTVVRFDRAGSWTRLAASPGVAGVIRLARLRLTGGSGVEMLGGNDAADATKSSIRCNSLELVDAASFMSVHMRLLSIY